MITWQILLERSPELAGLRADARSVALHERWPWYERWLPGSLTFTLACRKAAERLGTDPTEVRQVLEVYRTARARLQVPERGWRRP